MKSYTSIEQSKRLAEFLPIESADMCLNISQLTNMKPLMTPYCKFKEFFNMEETPDFLIPCWSLAALLNYLREIEFFPEIDANELEVTMSITYFNDHEARHLTPVHNITVKAESFIDACCEIIIKLKELNLL